MLEYISDICQATAGSVFALSALFHYEQAQLFRSALSSTDALQNRSNSTNIIVVYMQR